MASCDRIISCAATLDLFRLVPAEKKFLLEEVFSKTLLDLQYPLQTPEPHNHNDYTSHGSEGFDYGPPPQITLSDYIAQANNMGHEALDDQTPQNSKIRSETQCKQEDYSPYWADFLSLCNFWEERELDSGDLKHDRYLDYNNRKAVNEEDETQDEGAERRWKTK